MKNFKRKLIATMLLVILGLTIPVLKGSLSSPANDLPPVESYSITPEITLCNDLPPTESYSIKPGLLFTDELSSIAALEDGMILCNDLPPTESY
ncbi:hypothetical protein I5677_03745 [Mobilitalea sibirica]|uniref:Uncharacterized protein n=1 Tax=Mobilitalea sibirica TaxID=1462919 RepID=A0A8J7HCG4_9FIRM|nr:hypothetical protein [Mobilitalea sibirica]MBH1940009.1 hypothetical protein [Mobilitalea sibirica]